MLITSEHLKGACPDQIDLFNKTFSVGAEFNKTNWDLALAVGLQVMWMERFLDESSSKIYDEARAPAWKIYEEAKDSALEKYNEAAAAALKIYDEATAPAWKIFNEATAPAFTGLKMEYNADAIYEETTAPALQIYEEATASAWKICEEATASAWEILNEIIAPAWKTYEEARTTDLFNALEQQFNGVK